MRSSKGAFEGLVEASATGGSISMSAGSGSGAVGGGREKDVGSSAGSTMTVG